MKNFLFLLVLFVSCTTPIYEQSTIPENWDLRAGFGANYNHVYMYEGGDMCYWGVHDLVSLRIDGQVEKRIAEDWSLNGDLSFTPPVGIWHIFPAGDIGLGIKLNPKGYNTAMKLTANFPYGAKLAILQGFPLKTKNESITGGLFLLAPVIFSPEEWQHFGDRHKSVAFCLLLSSSINF